MPTWVAIDVGLESNRKVLTLAALMGWTPDSVAIFVVRFLLAVRTDAPDGDVSGWSDDAYAAIARSHPDTGTAIRSAMLRAGMLSDSDGKMLVSGWVERNGKHLRDAERMRNVRARSRNVRARSGEQEQEPEDLPLASLAVSVGSKSLVEASSSGAGASTNGKVRARNARREREPDGFTAFYVDGAYPRKDARRAAAKAFVSALKRHPDLSADDLVWAAGKYREQVEREGREERFVPMPATWLNQDRFLEYFRDVPETNGGQC